MPNMVCFGEPGMCAEVLHGECGACFAQMLADQPRTPESVICKMVRQSHLSKTRTRRSRLRRGSNYFSLVVRVADSMFVRSGESITAHGAADLF